jgi:rubredoxin
MTLGHETCRACDWKHIFWEDEGEPQPQLIASTRLTGGFVCPKCRAEGASRMLIGAVPASVLYTEDEIKAAAPKPPRMTPRQHLRALARLFAPWDEDKRVMCLVIVSLGLALGSLYSLVTWNVSGIYAVVMTYWVFYELFLVFRASILLIVVILGSRSNLKEFWREQGQQPLFANFRNWRLDRRWERELKRRRRR